MSQLCLQAEGGQSQPSSVFLFYLITQWVIPIHTGGQSDLLCPPVQMLISSGTVADTQK